MRYLKYVLLILLIIFVYQLGQPRNMHLTNLDYPSYPLRVDSSTLLVKNKKLLETFYSQIGNVPINIIEDPLAKKTLDNSTGLYHNAFVFQDGATLAKVLQNLLQNYPKLYEGSANHSVSLAFYFRDPEGNGIELYWDTPQDTWVKDKLGHINMETKYVDPQGFIKEFSSHIQSTKIYQGHIHMKVDNLKNAESFYKNILGFDIKNQMDSALFFSSGGYHHHIGANIWTSENGPKKASNTLGLIGYTLHAKPDVYIKIKANLATNNYPSSEKNNTVEITDPWGIKVEIKLVQ